MKDCEKLDTYTTENRKAYIEKQNRLIQKKQKTPEPSILGSSAFSQDISLNSLSLKSESEDVKESTFRNFSSRSRKPSELYYECVTSKLSEKDQKILKLMALRRETKIEESELALVARNIWEAERVQQAKQRLNSEEHTLQEFFSGQLRGILNSWLSGLLDIQLNKHHENAEKQKTALMEQLAKKKEIEQLENAIRRNYLNENLRKEKMILEMKISEKHEKVERRQKEINLQKKLKPEILTTRYQVLLHQELKKQKEKEEEMEKVLHKQQFEAKEKRSEEKLNRIFTERCRRLREESLKQNLRWQAAKNVREEMNKKWEEEKIRHLRYSEKNQFLRRERVNWAKEWRRKIILEKNEREKQQHAIIYNKVKEEEREKVNRTRRKIQAKDFKMKILKEKRDEAITKSRFNARMTADLREQMRAIYEL